MKGELKMTMKKPQLKVLILIAVIMLAVPSASLGAGSQIEIEGEDASIFLWKKDEYTFVTPETLDENMDLCLSHGGTEKAAWERFGTGHVVWEAYHPNIEGRIRLEIYEDEWTHYVWDSQTMGTSLMKQLSDDLLNAGWLGGHYYFMSLYYQLFDDAQYLAGAFHSVPPYEYESGRCVIHFYNGRAFMFLYADSKAASKEGYWSEKTRDMLVYNQNPLRNGNAFRRDSKALANAPHMVDLLPDRTQWVLNLNSGAFALTGITERGAAVTLEAGGQTVEAKVDERAYTGTVTLKEGDDKIILRAKKGEQPENVIEIPLPAVDDAKAVLVLSQFPYGYADRDDLWIKGFTDPAGTVTVTVDEGAPIRAEVKADGSFEVPYTGEDWVEHTIEITASQEGKADCTIQLPSIPTYNDAEKGVNAYRKTLNEWVRPDELSEHPEDYLGQRLTYEIKVENWTVQNGRITMMAGMSDRKSNFPSYQYPICLVYDSYADDFFRVGQELTVMGEMLTPTLTDPSYPRMQVQYTVQVIGGSRW